MTTLSHHISPNKKHSSVTIVLLHGRPFFTDHLTNCSASISFRRSPMCVLFFSALPSSVYVYHIFKLLKYYPSIVSQHKYKINKQSFGDGQFHAVWLVSIRKTTLKTDSSQMTLDSVFFSYNLHFKLLKYFSNIIY